MVVTVKSAWVDHPRGRVHLLLDLPGDRELDVTLDRVSHPNIEPRSFALLILSAILEPAQGELFPPALD